MTASIPSSHLTVTPAASSKSYPSWYGMAVGVFRLPSDPYYYFALTILNAVIGSRYRVTRHDNGAELATGVIGSASEDIFGIPSFGAPMLMDITIRNASGSPNYRIFETSVNSAKAGASAYILQQLDE